ncbi:MAG: dimethylsulfonioproprionate lyase family protein [Paracoccaceae bacterium]|jgi:quercetin dioxygenase-like cupin family protein|nr:dimethylsulfonioproprionate lyase family protein [Paracoccaceae bacterium]
MSDPFDKLLEEVRDLHLNSPALLGFCPFPDKFDRQDVEPFHVPAAELMRNDPALTTDSHESVRDAFIGATDVALWRETYKGTRLEQEFRERFACYCLIGEGGPFYAPEMGTYVVYMPPGLYYPFHHHPAEEIYYVIAGEAEFLLQGEDSKILRSGDHVFHPSNRPHATQTHDKPFMAIVYWRGDQSIAPVLTYPDGDT